MIRSDSVFTCGASNGKTQECQEQRVEEHSRSVLNIQEANESKTHGKERERERERERGGGSKKASSPRGSRAAELHLPQTRSEI